MKIVRLKLQKKKKLTAIRRVKQEINDIIQNCLDDIRPYIITDIFIYLKKKGIIYAEKPKTNNKKKKKK